MLQGTDFLMNYRVSIFCYRSTEKTKEIHQESVGENTEAILGRNKERFVLMYSRLTKPDQISLANNTKKYENSFKLFHFLEDVKVTYSHNSSSVII